MDPKYEPVPTIVIVSSVSSSKPRLDFDDDGRSDDEDDSDHDDSMAVIDDENEYPYGSAPGTPQSPWNWIDDDLKEWKVVSWER